MLRRVEGKGLPPPSKTGQGSRTAHNHVYKKHTCPEPWEVLSSLATTSYQSKTSGSERKQSHKVRP